MESNRTDLTPSLRLLPAHDGTRDLHGFTDADCEDFSDADPDDFGAVEADHERGRVEVVEAPSAEREQHKAEIKAKRPDDKADRDSKAHRKA